MTESRASPELVGRRPGYSSTSAGGYAALVAAGVMVLALLPQVIYRFRRSTGALIRDWSKLGPKHERCSDLWPSQIPGQR